MFNCLVSFFFSFTVVSHFYLFISCSPPCVAFTFISLVLRFYYLNSNFRFFMVFNFLPSIFSFAFCLLFPHTKHTHTFALFLLFSTVHTHTHAHTLSFLYLSFTLLPSFLLCVFPRFSINTHTHTHTDTHGFLFFFLPLLYFLFVFLFFIIY